MSERARGLGGAARRRFGEAVGRGGEAWRRLATPERLAGLTARARDATAPFDNYRALAAATGLFVAGLAGLVVWLAMQAGPTLVRLEGVAVARPLTVTLALPVTAPPAEPAVEQPEQPAPTAGDGDGEAQSEAESADETDAPEPPMADLRQLIIGQDDPPSDEAPPPSDDAAPTSDDVAPASDDAAPESGDAPADGYAPAGNGPSAEPDDRLPASLVDAPLVPAPVAAITETSPFGELPKVGPEEEVPWRVYARPFDVGRDRPRVAIVVRGLGLDPAVTARTAAALPPDVTLAFVPYPDDTAALMAEAREQGHETLLMLPMEPTDYPQDDPGPRALLTRLSPDANRQRLEWLMGRASGYVGFIGLMGGAFAADSTAFTPMLQILARRGLVYVDNRPDTADLATRLASEAGVARASIDRVIDREENRDAIDLALRELEDVARQRGVAVGLAHPYPVTVDRLIAWAATLEAKDIDLAPVSAVVNLQPDS